MHLDAWKGNANAGTTLLHTSQPKPGSASSHAAPEGLLNISLCLLTISCDTFLGERWCADRSPTGVNFNEHVPTTVSGTPSPLPPTTFVADRSRVGIIDRGPLTWLLTT